MTKIISLSNHKGGVGKTTSTINIGAAFAQLKKKVLIIDFDPQANLTASLGVSEAESNIYGALHGRYPLEPYEVFKNFHVCPATIDLSAFESEVSNQPAREYYLDDLLQPLKNKYDYILIDCPPSLGLLTLNAFTASNEIIIPLQSEFLAKEGLNKLLEVVAIIQRRLNPSLTITGVFLTQYDNRKSLNKMIHEVIKETYNGHLFETKIRDNIALAEAPAYKQDIFRYNPKCNGAQDYTALAKEIIKRHKK